MEKNVSRAELWNNAGRAGLVLGLVSVAYMLLSQLMVKGAPTAGKAFLISTASLILWAAKFAGCIYLMKLFMQRYASAHSGVTNSDTFKFGVAIALLSALLYSGFTLAYTSFIAPDTFKDAMAAVSESYGSMLGEDALESLDEINLGTLSFFSNLIYCFLFGTVLSSILSRNIPSTNPFADGPDNQ